MSPFTRPELVLRRCDELLSVGQPMAALSSISEVFTSKRFRSTPLSTLEPILIKFLGLCVDLRKGRTAKEGLHMYRNVAQNTSVQSVEVVIQEFLTRSKEKVDEALAKVDELEGPAPDQSQQAQAAAGDNDVEDLEASETPESILLSAVSEEKSRDRTYRLLVTPWLRFLWEAYRTALDILRNNARLEGLYQTVCHEAFTFCLTHQRKTEFRRLAETLRSHLASSQKYSQQAHSINLNDPETLQRHLDTRFQQLNTAVELELWQEAFRTAEDIHGLLGMTKRAPKASMMSSYYEKMVKVFAVGQNYLFHSAAYGKLYAIHAARAAITGSEKDDSDLERLSSLVLLSALAVPISSSIGIAAQHEVGEEGEVKGKLGRLTALLSLSKVPTRAGLLSDAINRHVLKRVSPELRTLYNILEVDFHPLSITSKIEPILKSLADKPETARYVEPLKEVVLARLFQQLAQVYSSLKLDRLVKLASYGADESADATRRRIERYAMGACRQGDLDIIIDHATGSVKFQEQLFAEGEPIASTSKDSINVLQPSAPTLIRTQLATLASTLYAVLERVSPDDSPLGRALASRAAAFAALEKNGGEERETLLARSDIIKRRKETAEEQVAKREKEEAQKRTLFMQQRAEEEARRQQEEVRNRELERVKKEMAALKRAETLKLAASIAEKSGRKVDLKTVENLDSSEVVRMQVEQMEKDKKELNQRLSSTAKRLDHLERAFRREEIPLLKSDYERQQKRDREAHEATQSARVEAARRQHAEDLAIKERLARIMPDYQSFRERTEKESREAFERQKAERAQKLAEAKEKRKQEVMAQRQKEREEREQREREEAERHAAEEEQRRIAAEKAAEEEAERARLEEEQRAAAEKAEAERAALRAEKEAQRQADLEKIRKQQQREEEALARRKAGGLAPAPTGPAPVGSAAWRAEREGASGPPRLNLTPRTAPVQAAQQPPAAAAPAAAAAAPAAVPGERRRLNLAPRTVPRAEAPAADTRTWRPAAPASATDGSRPASREPLRRNDNSAPPAAVAAAAAAKEADEGFQTVGAAKKQPAYRPPQAGGGGAYRPPQRRTAGDDRKW